MEGEGSTPVRESDASANLYETPLDEDLLADIPQGVGDGAGGHLAPEDVAHVLPGQLVPGHVGEVLPVVPADPPHPDGVDGLRVEGGPGVGVHQLQAALI